MARGSFIVVHGLLSSSGMHTGSVVAVHWLSSCGVRAPECMGSVAVARGLSCPVACGILVPQPGIKPASPALQDRFLTPGPPGKSPDYRL